MQIDWVFAAMLLSVSVMAALGALAILSVRLTRQMAVDPPRTVFPTEAEDAVFLFDGEVMVDATDAGRALIAGHAEKGGDWATVTAFLSQHFSGVLEALATLEDVGQIRLDGHGANPLALAAEWRNGLVRLTVSDPKAEGHDLGLDRLSYRAMARELETLRATTENLPVMIWRQTPEQAVVWANRAYLAYFQKDRWPEGASGGLSWPLPVLFGPAMLPAPETPSRRIQGTKSHAETPQWFECHAYALGDDVLYAAIPADGIVNAEARLKDFRQTMTRTFAELPIGLAIFDNQRKLVVFNPALTDLTALDAVFLSARPTLLSFLDRLRENQRMPEPKDYRSWRQQMAVLEAAAANGQYTETWTLPSGEIYKVIGRPHPDGALALLFEDISADMLLTRRFRAQIEIGQSVLDSLPEAIAVFSHSGAMEYSNAAFAALWGADASRAENSILDVLRHMQTQALPGPVWADIASFVSESDRRKALHVEAQMKGGRRLSCRIAPLPGGATLVGFTPAADARRQNARMVIRYRPRKTEAQSLPQQMDMADQPV